MKLTDSFCVRPDVMAREVGDETVILELESGSYFGLDPIGTRIWALLVEGKTLAKICDVMLSEYDVSREELESDTRRLAQELADRALIEVQTPTAEP